MVEKLALLLSVLSAMVALATAYVSHFQRGRIEVPPIRAVRLDPLRAYDDERQPHRIMQVTIVVALVNTGARTRAVEDLRIRVSTPGVAGDLLLDWREEWPSLRAEDEGRRFATQPTLGPHASVSHIYSFDSRVDPESVSRLAELEKMGTDHSDRRHVGILELREGESWTPLRRFTFKYDGSRDIQTGVAEINELAN
ncbi:MAG: hypothetical protein AAF533_13735 [Acidobacteriota bacterium]